MKAGSGSARLDDQLVAARSGVPVAPPSRTAWAVVVGASACLMLAVGLWDLNRHSMWRDEVATYAAVHRSVPELWAMLHNVDAVHSLYYLGQHYWMSLGRGEVWMRIPSLVASVVSAGWVGALGARLGGVREGLAAGILFAAMPIVSFYAQEARPFAIVSAWVLAATYFLVVAMERGRGWWPAYAVAITIAALTNELAVLALAAHAVTLWVHRAGGRTWSRWASCAAVCAVAVTPVVLVSSTQSEQVEWLATPSLALLGNLAQLFLGPNAVLIAVTAVLAIIGLVLARRGAGLELVAAAAPLALVPPVVLIIVSFVDPLFHPRYVLYAAAGIPLLSAVGLVRLTSGLLRRRMRWLAGSLIGLIVLAICAAELPALRFVRTVDSRPDDLAAAATAVRLNAQPGDPVLFVPGLYRLTALGYPESFSGINDLALAESPAESASLSGRDLEMPQTDAAMLTVNRVWVIGRPNLAVFPTEAKSLAKRGALNTHFRRTHVIHVHGLDVALYEKRISG